MTRSIALSPNGNYLAYVKEDKFHQSHLYIKDLKQSMEKKLLPMPYANGIREFFWQYDNQYILWTADKDHNANVHLYQYCIETGKLVDLTPKGKVYVQSVSYLSTFPNDLLVTILDWENRFSEHSHDLYRINLKEGTLSLDTEAPGYISSWGIDHQGFARCAILLKEKNKIGLLKRISADSSWEEVFEQNLEGFKEWAQSPFVAFSEDLNSVYLVSNAASDTYGLIKVDLNSGKWELLQADPEYDFQSAIVSHDGKKIRLIRLVREGTSYIAFDPQFDSILKEIKKNLNGSIRIISRDQNDQRWVIQLEKDVLPPTFILYHTETGAREVLVKENEEIEHYSLCQIKPIHFMARDGMKISAYLTMPSMKESPSPAVILVHGGPWSRDVWKYDPLVQWLANRGMAVLQINFRGSIGYGKTYLNAGDREWGRKMHTDLLDGKQWLIDQGIVDQNHVAIMGSSYGGYASMCGLTMTPDEFCCGIALAGIYDLTECLKTPQNPGQLWWLRRVGDNEEFLKSISPFYSAHQLKKPCLMVLGANDIELIVNDAKKMAEAICSYGLSLEFLVFPDEGHVIGKPMNKRKFAAAAEQFFSEHLGTLYEEPGQEELWADLKQSVN